MCVCVFVCVCANRVMYEYEDYVHVRNYLFKFVHEFAYLVFMSGHMYTRECVCVHWDGAELSLPGCHLHG